MAVAVTVSLKGLDLAKFSKAMSKNLPEETNKEVFSYAKQLAKKLQVAAVTDPLRPITANRRNAAQLIKAKKQSVNRSVVTMPRSLVLLDSMKPHYVSLKKGRNITAWARKNYGSATITGRSTAYRGPRGGMKGALYVTPHRFVQRTLNTERNKLPNHLRKAIRKAYSASVAK